MREDRKMKNIAKLILLVSVSLSAVMGCAKFDQMNKNPYALYEGDLQKYESAELYIQPILYNTEYCLSNVFKNITGQLMQYCVSTSTEVTSRVVANYNIAEANDDDIWTLLYTQYGNAVSMYALAIKEANPTKKGIASVLKAMIIGIIADTYGNVPYSEAALFSNKITNLSYDNQKDIYRAMIVMLEEANAAFSDPTAENVNALTDYMFKGDKDKWQRFGNALYLRTLMRISSKVIEEDGGVLDLNNDDWGMVDVKSKLAELFSCYQSGSGNYPVMRSKSDCAWVGFDKYNASLQTPFYSTTSGLWNSGGAACETLVRQMLATTKKTKTEPESGKTVEYYLYSPSGAYDAETGEFNPTATLNAHIEDPRYDAYFRKTVGAPTQMLNIESQDYFRILVSSAGNSLVGRMPNGDVTSAITKKVYDIKNADHFALMNYSEQLFLFAEAGARGYIQNAASFSAYTQLMKEAITASCLEWVPDLESTSAQITKYVDYVCADAVYSGSSLKPSNALEAILTQKWISLYFVGVEAWCDYRRTGYPLLKTNGPAADNKNVLPTRLRYPADEEYRNPQTYREAVDGWLGGVDNMRTEVWWADTQESRDLRLKGRI